MTSPFIYAEDLLENSHGSLEALDHLTTFLYVLVCFYSNIPLRRVLDSSKEKETLCFRPPDAIRSNECSDKRFS